MVRGSAVWNPFWIWLNTWGRTSGDMSHVSQYLVLKKNSSLNYTSNTVSRNTGSARVRWSLDRQAPKKNRRYSRGFLKTRWRINWREFLISRDTPLKSHDSLIMSHKIINYEWLWVIHLWFSKALAWSPKSQRQPLLYITKQPFFAHAIMIVDPKGLSLNIL